VDRELMAGLVEFLTARLDEDEQTARAATGKYRSPTWRVDGDDETLLIYPDDGSTGFTFDGPIAPHIARHDPARVLADVAAKRRVLERHAECGTGYGYCDDGGHVVSGGPCPDLRDAVAPYADHPDYDAGWRP
jgi:hypothetical protein